MNEESYFKFSEFVKTDCSFPNSPLNRVQLSNLIALWKYLDTVRERLDAPIIINSAFRSPAVNEQVGGAKCSLHMQGRAADIRTSPHKMEQLWSILQNDRKRLKELIKYSTFYHVAL